MALFSQIDFDAFVLGLPGTALVDQWDSRVGKVGGKVFALLSQGESGPRITFKCGEESFDGLTALAGIGQAAYFAKRQWVSVGSNSELPEHELRQYVLRSYHRIAAGLTRKARAELGIPEPQGG